MDQWCRRGRIARRQDDLATRVDDVATVHVSDQPHGNFAAVRPREFTDDAVLAFFVPRQGEAAGGKFLFTEDLDEATRAIVETLDRKRAALKLAPMLYGAGAAAGAVAPRSLATYDAPRGVVSLGCGQTQKNSQSRPPRE